MNKPKVTEADRELAQSIIKYFLDEKERNDGVLNLWAEEVAGHREAATAELQTQVDELVEHLKSAPTCDSYDIEIFNNFEMAWEWWWNHRCDILTKHQQEKG